MSTPETRATAEVCAPCEDWELRSPIERRGKYDNLAHALGWVSLGVGLAGVAAVVAGRKVHQERTATYEAQHGGSVRVRTITVYRPVDEVYAFWRELENLPLFMTRLKSVQEIGDGRSHWVAEGPAGIQAEWDAAITEEIPNELIAWRSLPGSRVHHSGRVCFEQARNRPGTEVRVELEFCPPGGMMGELAAWLFGKDPGNQLKDDLRAFKSMLETGEVPISDALRRPGPRLSQHAAQPAPERELARAA